MRIFQVLEGTTNNAVPGNQTWHRNLYEPLVDLGNEVYVFSSREGRIAKQSKNKRKRSEYSQKMLDIFKKENDRKPFDLFFAYLMDGMVDPLVIDEIKKLGVPTCNFSCNNTHQFYLVDGLSPHFDYNLHSEKDAKQKFLDVDANPVWWPMESNPKYFKPFDTTRDIDVSFVGANYALRSRYIAHLLNNKIDVQVYGPGWTEKNNFELRSFAKRNWYIFRSIFAFDIDRQAYYSGLLFDYDYIRTIRRNFPGNLHSPISDEHLIKLYSKSKISLGFLEVYDEHNPSNVVTQHLHLREFEAPMSGALYITGYHEELADMYDLEKEVVTYRSRHELLDKVKYYLDHHSQAEMIRKAARKRALKSHSYHQRYRELFKKIGIK